MPEQDSNSSTAGGERQESWHILSEADTLGRLNASKSGLTGKEAAERLKVSYKAWLYKVRENGLSEGR